MSFLKKHIILLAFPLCCVFTYSCGQKNGRSKQQTKNSITNNQLSADGLATYNFNSPDATWEMPRELVEISGISFYGKNGLAAINDEEGIIYIYDLNEKKISAQFKFGKSGDYEDLAVDGNIIYALRSDGTIFKVTDMENNPATEKFTTPLSSSNNTEGLYLNKTANQLLIACKGEAGKDLPKHTKAVYSFSLATNKLGDRPFLSITEKAIQTNLGEKNEFAPSAISFNPADSNYYILSSVGKILVVFNNHTGLQHVYKLDENLFKQPEGLAITDSGDIYISNEGKWGKGIILLFKKIKIN